MVSVAPPLYPVQQRDAFLIPSSADEDDDDRFHLFFVMTDPAKHASILLVNISTVHENVPHDATCYVNAGEHPFVTRQSYVFYAKARILTTQRLQSLIAAQTVIPRPPVMSEALFDRVAVGIASVANGGSPLVDPTIVAFFMANR